MSEETPAQSNPDDAEAASTPAGLEEAVPMNRAERRAKGKKGAGQQGSGGKPQFTPKNSQGHGPRLWANRRAG